MTTTTQPVSETITTPEYHAPSDQPLAAILPRPAFDYTPKSLDGAMQMAQLLAESDLVPKDYRGKAGNVFVAMQWGNEIGLRPLQALQNIAVINGRPSLWGDAVLALCLSSPACEYVREEFTADGQTAICRAKRRGDKVEKIGSFSMEDAQRAGLLSKDSPWKSYPQRMLKMRARAWALRDAFPDVLKGIAIAEEVQDIPNEEATPAAVPPRVALPQAKSHQGPQAQTEEPSGAADTTPASGNMLKMLGRKLEAATISNAECAKFLGVDNLDHLSVSDVNRALAWASNPAG